MQVIEYFSTRRLDSRTDIVTLWKICSYHDVKIKESTGHLTSFRYCIEYIMNCKLCTYNGSIICISYNFSTKLKSKWMSLAWLSKTEILVENYSPRARNLLSFTSTVIIYTCKKVAQSNLYAVF